MKTPPLFPKILPKWGELIFILWVFFILGGESLGAQDSFSPQDLKIPRININFEEAQTPQQVGGALQILFLMTILSLSPSLLIMMTCFTRILIVLGFVRRALTTAQEPSNQILIGLALFMTFYVMSPVIQEINVNALKPYLDKKIDYKEGFTLALKPLRTFMFRQVNREDLALFLSMENDSPPQSKEEVSTLSLTAGFILSEIKVAFQMGVIIFLPFLVIDLVIASTLMAMGMIMLPPNTISLPFKIILFVLVDGWNLIIKALVESF